MRTSLAFVLLLAIASPARAADSAIEEAKAHVRAATAAYNLGRYLEAASEYESAYTRTLDPNLLFNIGQSYRLAGDRDKAMIAYRSFLRSAPRSEQRALAESKLRDLEQESATAPSAPMTAPLSPPAATPPVTAAPLAPEPSAEPSLPAPAPSTSPSPPIDLAFDPPAQPEPQTEAAPFYTRWPFWTAVGAVVVAGAVLGIVLSQRDNSNLNMGNPSLGSQEY